MFHLRAERKIIQERHIKNRILSVELGSSFFLAVCLEENFVKFNTLKVSMHIYLIIVSKHSRHTNKLKYYGFSDLTDFVKHRLKSSLTFHKLAAKSMPTAFPLASDVKGSARTCRRPGSVPMVG